MNVRNLFLFLFFFTTLISISAFSQIQGGNTYAFLNLPISARVSSLGGGLLSTKDNDLNISLTNPALLTDSMSGNVALSLINYFGSVSYGYAAFAKNIRKNENFSVGIQYVNYGKFTSADEFGNIYGSFGANEMSFNVSYARCPLKKDSNFSVGATLKTIYSNLDSYTSVGSAFDLGAFYTIPSQDLSFAAVMKNAGWEWKPYTVGDRESLPFEVQLGLTIKPKHAPIRFSIVYKDLQKWNLSYLDTIANSLGISGDSVPTNTNNKFQNFTSEFMRHIILGAEVAVSKNFFLRLGYNYQNRINLEIPLKPSFAGFSFGFGFRVYKFHLSYGHAVYNVAGASNNFSISFDINNFYHKTPKAAKF